MLVHEGRKRDLLKLVSGCEMVRSYASKKALARKVMAEAEAELRALKGGADRVPDSDEKQQKKYARGDSDKSSKRSSSHAPDKSPPRSKKRKDDGDGPQSSRFVSPSLSRPLCHAVNA